MQNAGPGRRTGTSSACSCAGREHASCLASRLAALATDCATDFELVLQPAGAHQAPLDRALAEAADRLQQLRDGVRDLPFDHWGRECDLPWVHVDQQTCEQQHCGCVIRRCGGFGLAMAARIETEMALRCWHDQHPTLSADDADFLTLLLRTTSEHVDSTWLLHAASCTAPESAA